MKKLLLILLCLPFFGVSQCVEGNCEDVYGVYVYSESRYEGEWKNKKKHGVGTYTWSDGDIYVGEYKYGKTHGVGTYIWGEGSNYGDKYVGEWKYGKKHGLGIYTWNNSGRQYLAEYRAGERVEILYTIHE